MPKNLSIEQQKAETLLCEIPRVDFLFINRTQEQIEQFLRFRYQYLLVSEYWKSYHTGGRQPSEFNELPQRFVDYIIDITHWFNDIWGFIFGGFSDIKKYAEKCQIDFPFNEPYEFFAQIAIFHADNQLEPYVMKYKEVSHKKTQAVLKICEQASERALEKSEIKKIDDYLKGMPKNIWLKLTMDVWDESKNPRDQDALEVFKRRTSRIAGYVRLETRTNKSYALVEGRKVPCSGVNGREGYKIS